jgi:hypothetical protein
MQSYKGMNRYITVNGGILPPAHNTTRIIVRASQTLQTLIINIDNNIKIHSTKYAYNMTTYFIIILKILVSHYICLYFSFGPLVTFDLRLP